MVEAFFIGLIGTWLILHSIEKSGHNTDKAVNTFLGGLFTLLIFPVSLFVGLCKRSK